ncbi:UNVERIFIED_CONTAM: protein RRP6-like 2, partial [Sesamum angustifolium]
LRCLITMLSSCSCFNLVMHRFHLIMSRGFRNNCALCVRDKVGARSCVHWLWLKLVIPWLGELWWSRFDEIVFRCWSPFLCLVGRASGILAEMRSTFGANDCRLLCINSSSTSRESMGIILCKGKFQFGICLLPPLSSSIYFSFFPETSISNNKQYGYFRNADDVEEVGSTIRDFSAKHIIPLMELKIGVLNQQVDLEHNQYRSFQGLTCLMQISTRTEDFIIDTPRLRVQIGPHLREVFKDPTKRKALHGADRDIVWLQRDFGIYVCNMFDTGQ